VRRAALGVGDDCALLQTAARHPNGNLERHAGAGSAFFPDVDPHKLGHKALAVNLSDLAACGAKPLAFTLALALPQVPMKPGWRPFHGACFALADAHDCELIGGDTTQRPLNICITVFGEVPAARTAAARPCCALARNRAMTSM
jgi:thiamine-monophosphate kinase